jgi:hypothetical protein
MGLFEYKVIPTPRRVKKAKGVKTEAGRFALTLTDVINAEAAEGWEYLRSETLPMDSKPGMLKKPVEMFQTVLVFRRAVATDEMDMSDHPAYSGVLDAAKEDVRAEQASEKKEASTLDIPTRAYVAPTASAAITAEPQGGKSYWD